MVPQHKQECNEGEHEKARGRENESPGTKSDTRHEGWEGVLVSDVEAFRELALRIRGID